MIVHHFKREYFIHESMTICLFYFFFLLETMDFESNDNCAYLYTYARIYILHKLTQPFTGHSNNAFSLILFEISNIFIQVKH